MIGLIPVVIFLLLIGVIYIGLSVGLSNMECEKELKYYGIVIGITYILTAILFYAFAKSESFTALSLLIILGFIMFVVNVMGLYFLLNKKGIECRYNGSKLWLALMIMYIILYFSSIFTGHIDISVNV